MARLVCKKYQLAFSPSHWVYAYGLDCNDALWVWFNQNQRIIGQRPSGPGKYLGVGGIPGVCCLYPGTAGVIGQNLYQTLAVWMYAGEGVHQFLYRKYGYTIVSPPLLPCAGCGVVVPTACCPGGLPGTLHATWTAQSGDCVLSSQTLTYNATQSRWEGPDPVNGGPVYLSCTGGDIAGWYCTLGADFLSTLDSGASSCDPLSLVFYFTNPGCAGDATLTVTL